MSQMQLECELSNAPAAAGRSRSSADLALDQSQVTAVDPGCAMDSSTQTSPFTASPVAIGELIAGKYRVERVLGEGGMGLVLAAQHCELGRRVAIKLLLPELAAVGMAAERFRREARASARIRGEHVCQVIDVGTHESGVPFMVMEYLDGRDLASELELRGRLPFAEAAAILLQACEAVATAHAVGVIHRDIKPANLFLERCADGTRRIKVLDFGVSKSLLDTQGGDQALTQTTSLLGSPLYMSPEQLDSAKSVDGRTDIWSLGVVLYELITGRTPFDGESIAQLVTAVLWATPRAVREFAPEVPPELEAVVARTLAKTRDERYASAAELAQALLPFATQAGARVSAQVGSLPPPAEAVRASDYGQEPKAASTSGDETLGGGRGGGPRKPRRGWLQAVVIGCLLGALGYYWLAAATESEEDAEAQETSEAAGSAEEHTENVPPLPAAVGPEPSWAPLPGSGEPSPQPAASEPQLELAAQPQGNTAPQPAAAEPLKQVTPAAEPPATRQPAGVAPVPATTRPSRPAPAQPARAVTAPAQTIAYEPPEPASGISNFGGRR